MFGAGEAGRPGPAGDVPGDELHPTTLPGRLTARGTGSGGTETAPQPAGKNARLPPATAVPTHPVGGVEAEHASAQDELAAPGRLLELAARQPVDDRHGVRRIAEGAGRLLHRALVARTAAELTSRPRINVSR
jgi:hypothetical protein